MRTLLPALAALALVGGSAHAAPRLVAPTRIELPADGGAVELTVENRGDSPLTVDHVRLAAPTASTSDGFQVADLHAAIVPGANAKVTVRYAPVGNGKPPAYAGLQIVSDDPDAAAHDRTTAVALRAGSSRLLSTMLFAPLVGMLLVILLPRRRESLARFIALGASIVPVVLSAWLFAHFDRAASGPQLVEHAVWVPAFHIEYFVGVDGLSVTMVMLTALVSLIALGASWNVTDRVKGYFAMFLLLETGMMGVFLALDFFLFYVFWEVMLLPMYFLIGLWGGPRKEYAAIKFFLYTLVGSVLMLLALIALYYRSAPTTLVSGEPAAHTFDLLQLTAQARALESGAPLLGFAFARLAWVLLFVGFAVKIPTVPLHTWLPDAHVEAPTAISVLLAGVLLKMGTYGLFRVSFQILPEATQWAAPAMAVFGVVNILYGAFCAFAQRDLKRLVAYSSVSHMGYCLLGMAALTPEGLAGAMLQMWNHGTITSMLFLLVGVLYDRAHTREIDRFGGVAQQMPRYAFVFGLAFMASLGLPGLSGFVSEMLVFLGAFDVYHVAVALAATGLVFTAAYHLWALQRVQLGPWNAAAWPDRSKFPDLSAREWATLLPLAAIVVVLGFWPRPALDLSAASIGQLVAHLAGAP